jgi:hypothetical protein
MAITPFCWPNSRLPEQLRCPQHSGQLGVLRNEFSEQSDPAGARTDGLAFRAASHESVPRHPHGGKVAPLFSRLESRLFRPAIAMFTSNDGVLPFLLRASLNRVDNQLD